MSLVIMVLAALCAGEYPAMAVEGFPDVRSTLEEQVPALTKARLAELQKDVPVLRAMDRKITAFMDLLPNEAGDLPVEKLRSFCVSDEMLNESKNPISAIQAEAKGLSKRSYGQTYETFTLAKHPRLKLSIFSSQPHYLALMEEMHDACETVINAGMNLGSIPSHVISSLRSESQMMRDLLSELSTDITLLIVRERKLAGIVDKLGDEPPKPVVASPAPATKPATTAVVASTSVSVAPPPPPPPAPKPPCPSRAVLWVDNKIQVSALKPDEHEVGLLIRKTIPVSFNDSGAVVFFEGKRAPNSLMADNEADGCWVKLTKEADLGGKIEAGTLLKVKWTSRNFVLTKSGEGTREFATFQIEGNPLISSIVCQHSRASSDTEDVLTVGEIRKQLGWDLSGILLLGPEPKCTALKSVGEGTEKLATLNPSSRKAGSDDEAPAKTDVESAVERYKRVVAAGKSQGAN